ncbi:MAG: YkgJ family cysteine cluster protein [Planctomycetes bacterium]|jgi:Fe-S-cluster containining protein|nr:YkgJ family cysteine cluster protein [Planctomycetota bacterium]
MVGEPTGYRRLIEEVAALYDWIETQMRQNPDRAGRCRACGACCDFPAYDHRLFVTLPELIYLAGKLEQRELQPMTAGRCPYQQERQCTVHAHRFAGCRIFCCTGDPGFQSELSEATLRRLKIVGEAHRLPYRYQDLPAALAGFSCDTCQSAAAPCPADRAD